MLRRLYDKTLALSVRPNAPKWLGGIAFIESFFFPIPADVLFLPMALAQPAKALRFAWIATIGSVLGGIFGYYLGMFGYEQLAKPMLEAMGKADKIEHYRELLQSDIVILWLLLLSSGFTHIPPIKIVTILSGFSGIDFWVFLLSAIIGRGGRFFLLGWLLKRYGEQIRHFIEKRFKWVALAGIAVLIGLYAIYKAVS